MNYALSKTATMVKHTPITIPTEPIGRIPRPVGLIEGVKKQDSEDPKLAPLGPFRYGTQTLGGTVNL
jgi:hypothetical protein